MLRNLDTLRKRYKTVTVVVKGANMHTFVFTFMLLIPLHQFHLGINNKDATFRLCSTLEVIIIGVRVLVTEHYQKTKRCMHAFFISCIYLFIIICSIVSLPLLNKICEYNLKYL